jgi:hypothetical protein
MKKFVFLTVLTVILAWSTACNNSGLPSNASNDSVPRPKDSVDISTGNTGTNNKDNTAPGTNTGTRETTGPNAPSKETSTCCFESMDEVQQFFPAGTNDIKPVDDVSGNLLCPDDSETQSTVSKSYMMGSTKFNVRISDYCINPRRIETDYERKHKNTLDIFGKDKEVQDLSGASYSGFAVYSPSGKNSFLYVVVDKRFGVTIAGNNQSSFMESLKMFDQLPVSKLAGFKK